MSDKVSCMAKGPEPQGGEEGCERGSGAREKQGQGREVGSPVAGAAVGPAQQTKWVWRAQGGPQRDQAGVVQDSGRHLPAKPTVKFSGIFEPRC